MLEKILEYERALFLMLNNAHCPFGDQFMWLFTTTITWIPTVVCFIFVLFYANRTRWKEMMLTLGAIILVIILCDQFSSGFCKPFFARFRPTHHPDFMNDVITVFDYRGGKYGFISSHAANGFGFATVTSLIFRNKFYSICLFLWAATTAYSRIYLGVHFISDIIPGILTGLFFGWIGYKLFVFAHNKLFVRPKTMPDHDPMPSAGKTNYFYNGLTITLSMLLATVFLFVVIGILYAYQLIPAITLKLH